MRFSWSFKKSRQNLKKHKVSFEEACTCFYDPYHLVIWDRDNSTTEEERVVLIGVSKKGRLLVVVHLELGTEEIRVISARKATSTERFQYEEGI